MTCKSKITKRKRSNRSRQDKNAADTGEADWLERRIVTIPAKDWKKFEAWANRPAQEIEGLKDLAGKAPTCQL